MTASEDQHQVLISKDGHPLRAVEAQGYSRKGTHALMLALASLSAVDWKITTPVA